jgi:iron complex outermembrane receptor protein
MATVDGRHGRFLMGGVALGALAFMLAAPAARAATETASGATSVQELIVTAERRSENIQDVPISIQAFTAKEIEDLGIKSSIDIGAVTPNVDIATPAGPGNQPIITIRGIGLNDYDTNNAGPNGVYVDEVYLSSPASQTFQAFDLDRIEVLKGPQGTLYGRNTSGGAINFITAKPTDTFTARLHVEYSSFNTVNVEAAVGGPIAPGLDGRFAFVKNYSQGYFHNDLTDGHENGVNNWAARAMLLWKPASDLSVLVNLHGGQVDNRVTEYRHIGDLSPTTGAQCSVADTNAGDCVDIFGYGTPKGFYDGSFNRNRHLKVNSLGGSLRADWSPGSISFTSLTAFEHNDKIHPEDSDASPSRLLEIDFGVRNNTFSQEFRAAHSSEKFNWVTGLYYLHEDLHQNQPIYILLDADKFFGGPGSGDGVAFQAFDQSHQVTNAYAVFGQGDYALTDKLKLTLGGRYTTEQRTFNYVGSVQFQMGGMDHFGPLMDLANTDEKLSNSAFNFRVAADYKIAPGVLAYASVATGYKSGDFNGSFLSLNPVEIALQLQPVKPEHVTAFEAGFKSSFFDNRLILDAAAFYNEYNDLQVFVLVPAVVAGGLPVNVLDNAKKAHTEGVEAQVQLNPFANFTASAQFGYLKTRLDAFVPNKDPTQPDFSGKELPISPHFSFAGLADYKIPLSSGAIDLQFSATYKSHQFFDISNDPYTVQNGYWIENARIAYDFPGDRLEVAGFVRNLSDQKYYLDEFDLTFLGFIQGIVGVPRSWGVELNYRF